MSISKFVNKNFRKTKMQKRVIPWFEIDGDNTLRLNYDLNENSLVFDLGGYKGDFSVEIFARYQCNIFIFEPVEDYYKIISNRFKQNSKVNVYKFGLSKYNQSMKINKMNDSSSIHKNNSSVYEKIEIKDIVSFIRENKIMKIDLMKINVEGSEYDILETLIVNGLVKQIENIQIQFHDFIPDAKKKMDELKKQLSFTHKLTYEYEFVWENWEVIEH